jgi:pimeloyl-ACP methyl ester carboxylesterase
LPNARLLSIDNAGHVPWIEASELVFRSIVDFFDTAWSQGTLKPD